MTRNQTEEALAACAAGVPFTCECGKTFHSFAAYLVHALS